MKKTAPTLYLFNNIFYPQTIIPLTVNDTTSKNLVLHCFEEGTEIILYYQHLRSKNIGTLGKILMLDYNQDGGMSVILQGLCRIQLLTLESEDPYPYYRFKEYFDVIENGQTLYDSPLERLHNILDNWLSRHVSSIKEREQFMKDMNSPGKLINNLCTFMIKDIELKQIFLESTSMLDRVRMMNALLIGNSPNTEDIEMCEAIKNFERLEIDHHKNAS